MRIILTLTAGLSFKKYNWQETIWLLSILTTFSWGLLQNHGLHSASKQAAMISQQFMAIICLFPAFPTELISKQAGIVSWSVRSILIFYMCFKLGQLVRRYVLEICWTISFINMFSIVVLTWPKYSFHGLLAGSLWSFQENVSKFFWFDGFWSWDVWSRESINVFPTPFAVLFSLFV